MILLSEVEKMFSISCMNLDCVIDFVKWYFNKQGIGIAVFLEEGDFCSTHTMRSIASPAGIYYIPWRSLTCPKDLLHALKICYIPWRSITCPKDLLHSLKICYIPWISITFPEDLLHSLKIYYIPLRSITFPEDLLHSLKIYYMPSCIELLAWTKLCQSIC